MNVIGWFVEYIKIVMLFVGNVIIFVLVLFIFIFLYVL